MTCLDEQVESSIGYAIHSNSHLRHQCRLAKKIRQMNSPQPHPRRHPRQSRQHSPALQNRVIGPRIRWSGTHTESYPSASTSLTTATREPTSTRSNIGVRGWLSLAPAKVGTQNPKFMWRPVCCHWPAYGIPTSPRLVDQCDSYGEAASSYYHWTPAHTLTYSKKRLNTSLPKIRPRGVKNRRSFEVFRRPRLVRSAIMDS